MKTELIEKLRVKSKTRKDGIYIYQFHFYAVRDNELLIYSDYDKIFRPYGIFQNKVLQIDNVLKMRKIFKETYNFFVPKKETL